MGVRSGRLPPYVYKVRGFAWSAGSPIAPVSLRAWEWSCWRRFAPAIPEQGPESAVDCYPPLSTLPNVFREDFLFTTRYHCRAFADLAELALADSRPERYCLALRDPDCSARLSTPFHPS